MVAFLIKFILCSGFLYSFYKFFLERESMYKINRFYLLFSLVFSLIAPLYKIDLPITANETNISPELLAFLMQNPELLQQQEGVKFGDVLNLVYILTAIVLLARFSYNLYELMFKIKTEEKIKDNEITYILDLDSNQPYSFWKYIFIPKKQLDNLHQNLIDHEKAHCIQKHSLDIVLIEVFQIIFWFNPFIYFYKKSIKLNHEFLADEYVLKRNSDLKTYQHQILDCIATQNPSMMASNFNFILTKKRLIMMTKNTSKQKVKILSFASLPFMLCAFVLFSQKSFAQEVEKKTKKVEEALEKPIQSQADLIFDQINNLKDTLSNSEKIEQTKTSPKLEKVLTKDQLKEILKSNPQNKIILNDAGDIILNDSIKIKDIVLKKELIPTVLYGTNGEVLQKIDPKDIDKIFVKKKEGYIEVIKKDSSVIKIFNSAENIPNVSKIDIEKANSTKMPMVSNQINFRNGFSIYTDKNGVEHKIQNSKIDELYLKEIKSDIKFKIDSKNGKVINLSKSYNPWAITVEPHSNPKSNYTVKSEYVDLSKIENAKTYSSSNNYSYTYKYDEKPKSLNEKLKELKLDEQNTKKKIKELEKLQKEERRKDKN